MTQKQTPRTFNMPRQAVNIREILDNLERTLQGMLNGIRNDLDNGATTFSCEDIAGIANVDVGDFDNGQVRFYTDTDDSDAPWLAVRIDDAVQKVELAVGGGGGLNNVVEDLTPQLGGNLDVNSKVITGFTASRALETNATGGIIVSAVTSAELNYLDGVTSAIQTQFGNKLSDVVDDAAPQLGGNLDVNGSSIVSASNGDIAITPNGTGDVILDGLKWPQADGSANQVLKTDGSAQLSWVANAGGGRVAYGNYTGAGEDNKSITGVGFTVRVAIVIPESDAINSYIKISGMADSYSKSLNNKGWHAHSITALTAVGNGFVVSNGDGTPAESLTTNNEKYTWIALGEG